MTNLKAPSSNSKQKVGLYLVELFVFQCAVFAILFTKRAKELPVIFLRLVIVLFFIQFIYYIDYDAGANTTLEAVHRFVCDILRILNIERDIADLSRAVPQILYSAFIFVYFVSFLWSIVCSVVFAQNRKMTAIYFKNREKSISFTLYTVCFYLHHYLVLASTGFSFVYLFTSPDKLTQDLQRNYPAAVPVFKAAVDIGVFMYLQELFVEIFLHVIDFSQDNVRFRSNQMIHVALHFVKIVFYFFPYDPNNFISYFYCVAGGIGALALIIAASIFWFPYYNFAKTKWALVLMTIIAFMGAFTICYYFLEIQSVFIYFLFFSVVLLVLSNTLFESIVIGKAIGKLKAMESDNPHGKMDSQRIDFLLFLTQMADNIESVTPRKFLLQAFRDSHTSHCRDPMCICATLDETEEPGANPFDSLLKIYLRVCEPAIVKVPDNLRVQVLRITLLRRVFKNNFAPFELISLLEGRSVSLNARVNYLLQLFTLDQTFKLIDLGYVRQTKINSEYFLNQSKNILKMTRRMAEFTETYLRIWGIVANDPSDLDKLRLEFLKLEQSYRASLQQFHLNSQKYPKSYVNTFVYAAFATKVLNDEQEFEKTLATLLKIRQTVLQNNLRLDNISDRFGENADKMVITVSGDRETMMQILEIHGNFTECFGYEREELVGQDISKIIPDHLAEMHNVFVNRFFERGTGNLFNRNRIVPCLAKDRHLVAVELLMRVVPGLSEGLRFVSLLTANMALLKPSLTSFDFKDGKHVDFMIFDESERVVGISRQVATSFNFPPDLIRLVEKNSKVYPVYLHDFFPQLKANPQARKDFLESNHMILSTVPDLHSERASVARRSTLHLDPKAMNFLTQGNHSGASATELSTYHVKLLSIEHFSHNLVTLGVILISRNMATQNYKKIREEVEAFSAQNEVDVIEAADQPSRKPKAAESEDYAKKLNQRKIKDSKKMFIRRYVPRYARTIRLLFLGILCVNLAYIVVKNWFDQTYVFDFANEFLAQLIVFSDYLATANSINYNLVLFRVYFTNQIGTNTLLTPSESKTRMTTFMTRVTRRQVYIAGNMTWLAYFNKDFELVGDNMAQRAPLFYNLTAQSISAITNSSVSYQLDYSDLISQITSLAYYVQSGPTAFLSNSTWNTSAAQTSIISLYPYYYFLAQNTLGILNRNYDGVNDYLRNTLDTWFARQTLISQMAYLGVVVLTLGMLALIGALLVQSNRKAKETLRLFTLLSPENVEENRLNCSSFLELLHFVTGNSVSGVTITNQRTGPVTDKASLGRVGSEQVSLEKKETLKSKLKSDSGKIVEVGFETKRRSLGMATKSPLLDSQVIILVALLLVFVLFQTGDFIFYMIWIAAAHYIPRGVVFIENCVKVRMGSFVNGFFNMLYPQVQTYQDWTDSSLQSITEIFNNNNRPAFTLPFYDLIITFQSDVCQFLAKNNYSSTSCSDPTISNVLGNGFETSIQYINSQLAQLQTNFTIGKNQLYTLETVDSLVSITTQLTWALKYCYLGSIGLLNDVGAIVTNAFWVKIGVYAGLVVLFLGLYLPYLERKTKAQNQYFTSLFQMISAKTILENDRVYDVIVNQKLDLAKSELLS